MAHPGPPLESPLRPHNIFERVEGDRVDRLVPDYMDIIFSVQEVTILLNLS